MKSVMFSSVVSLFLSTICFAAPTPGIDCQPRERLDSPLRVRWDSLLSVDRIHTEGAGIVLEGRMHDSFTNRDLSFKQTFLQAPSGNMITLEPVHPLYLEFNRVLFEIRDIQAPVTAGPLPSGNWPATGSLVLISEYRAKSGAPLQVDVRNIDLDCHYQTPY